MRRAYGYTTTRRARNLSRPQMPLVTEHALINNQLDSQLNKVLILAP